ncbi:proline-rich receptor-like protein kinase PERK14 [Glycine max]|uniref:proline-rich receptor-like protein kinase PERK14 n=1 Tax=Glycine max TaxID=3847 RepID=UPI001B354B5D|nr:proline-rich receptor-like protein kinase PERK14 [Glycine max]
MDSPPASASYVVVACDATRERTEHEIKLVVDHVQERHVFLPSVGYQTLTCPESFAGTNFRAREDEVKKKVDAYATKLLPSYEDFESEGGISIKGECRLITSQIDQKQNQSGFLPKHSDAPLLCTGCGTRLSIKESMRFSYSDIQSATNDFSKDKLLGEGGYGHVYNGVLKDGQQIAAKVRKEESSHGPGFLNFILRCVLSFSRHKNIVMLLGYCCKEKKNILIYEYICNKSLHWHLFENNEAVLEWHQRYAIAIGTAKELRFLHEECRGGPIIHRDMRPSNRLLTHDFVPMLGDFGLAKWKTGRQVGNSKNPEQQQSLRLWAEPMIEKLALHELIDTRLGESYDTYELYLMAKDAYFCVQRKPEMRPSMGELLQITVNSLFSRLCDFLSEKVASSTPCT